MSKHLIILATGTKFLRCYNFSRTTGVRHLDMNHRIHIFGASGSGTSTLAAHLAREIGGYHLDTDSYYWHKSDPPYTYKREPSERIKMIEHDIQHNENWVLSGSICS